MAVNLPKSTVGMMIIHPTLDYHVTNLTRSLDGSDGQIKTLTHYSDPNPNIYQNPFNIPNPNEKIGYLPYMAMSRDIM